MKRDILPVDARGRISLGKYLEDGIGHYIVSKHHDGSISLIPAVVMPLSTATGIDEFLADSEAGVQVERPGRKRPTTMRTVPLELHLRAVGSVRGFIPGDVIVCTTLEECREAEKLVIDAGFGPSVAYPDSGSGIYAKVGVAAINPVTGAREFPMQTTGIPAVQQRQPVAMSFAAVHLLSGFVAGDSVRCDTEAEQRDLLAALEGNWNATVIDATGDTVYYSNYSTVVIGDRLHA